MPKQFLISLLLILAFSPRPIRGQLRAETKLSPLEAPKKNANAPSASTNKTIAVVLPKSLDTKKLKVGETYIVETASSTMADPSSKQIVMRVIEASPLNTNANKSRISLQFEPLHLDPSSGRARILRLEIQAVASPPSIVWSSSLVMVDRFPCDPQVARNGCDKPDKDDDPASRLGSKQLAICEKDRPKKQQPAQSRCASQNEARGVYGYPDLSLSASADGNASTSIVTSAKKNVRLETGTYLVLTGPDIDAVLQPKP
jgi:hypothetical protein